MPANPAPEGTATPYIPPAPWAAGDKPDPTTAVNEAVERASKAERDYTAGQVAILEARLDANDKATEIRLSKIDNVPSLISSGVDHLNDLVKEKMVGIHEQFQSLAARTAEQKADTTKALTDALAAQKEAVANQTASSEKSITKSETATTERIKGVEALLATQGKATDDKISDLKDRIIAIESVKLGSAEQRNESQNFGKYAIAIIGSFIGVAGFITTLIIVITRK